MSRDDVAGRCPWHRPRSILRIPRGAVRSSQRPARGDGRRPLRLPHGHRSFWMRPSPPPVCPQINPAGAPVGTEDCLKLNIWAPHPRSGPPLPVIVWLHGGSFISASGGFAGQNGTRFVEEQDAVVVAPNYRLGPFGFLGHCAFASESSDYPSTGNYGLLDQRLALEWVRTHIAAFGGDPNRITIAGQSAGGLSVSLHLVSPGSHGLFDRAIMQGGFASYRWRTREDGEAQADAFATALGCTDAAAGADAVCARRRWIRCCVRCRLEPNSLPRPVARTGARSSTGS